MVPLLVYVIVRAGITDSQSRLDHGGGKDLSLPECSREQLEKEVQSLIISVTLDVNGTPPTEDYVSEIRDFMSFHLV